MAWQDSVESVAALSQYRKNCFTSTSEYDIMFLGGSSDLQSGLDTNTTKRTVLKMLVRIKFPYDTIVSEQDYEKIVSLAGEDVIKNYVEVVARADGRLTTYSDTFMTYDTNVKAGELVTRVDGYVALSTDRSFVVDLLELYAAVQLEIILCSFLNPVTRELDNIEIIKNAVLDIKDIMFRRV